MTLDAFITRWSGKPGGAEQANSQSFLKELCAALDLPQPEVAEAGVIGDYRFEAPVRSAAALGTKAAHRIDLYRRDAFILEAKQSQLKDGETVPPPEPLRDLLGDVIPGVARAPRYDRLMTDARVQAERYALALLADHRTPPFIIVCDVGRAFELYFDTADNGRGYSFFPDQQSYRITLEDLRRPAIADRLRRVWSDPASIDPRRIAVRVTGDIAKLLASVARSLEEDQQRLGTLRAADSSATALGIESTSLFLMRLLFCMFAEDVELLPKDSFEDFLDRAKGRSDTYWRHGLDTLWRAMNTPAGTTFWPEGDAVIRYFNGNLFADTQIYPLSDGAKNTLLIAAQADWRAVEPAIFGTLLEQVLTPADRARLGAHYTPRAYVERLVEATVMDVLRPEWAAIEATARAAADAGDTAAALAAATAFHTRLAAVTVLDPACGTGNFLYVAMESLLLLEGAVIEFTRGLGAPLAPVIDPNQFLGIEKNPRAAVIAELVLWIGWLRFRLANTPDAIVDPILMPLHNINGGTHGGCDAVLVLMRPGNRPIRRARRRGPPPTSSSATRPSSAARIFASGSVRPMPRNCGAPTQPCRSRPISSCSGGTARRPS